MVAVSETKPTLIGGILLSQHASVLVTGGGGFIGSYLVERLLAEGAKVTVIDDFSSGNPANLRKVLHHPDLALFRSKVSECPDLLGLVGGCDYVFHLAAAVGVEMVVKSPIHTMETNLTETAAILEATSNHGVPTLITSTSEVYGKSQKAVFCEEDDLLIGPPNLSRWSYACSKLADEFLAFAHSKERNLGITVARIFNTVGPRQTGQYGMVLPRFIAAAIADQPLRVYGDGTQTRCFCYVEDTVEALLRLSAAPAALGQVVNVGSSEEISIEGLAERVISLLESKSAIEKVEYGKAYAPGFEDMQRRKPDTSKLLRLTGFQPRTSLDQIIRRTAGL